MTEPEDDGNSATKPGDAKVGSKPPTFAVGTCECIGHRKTMEDAMVAVQRLCFDSLNASSGTIRPLRGEDEKTDKDGRDVSNLDVYGVLDGHGGKESSRFCSKVLLYNIYQNLKKTDCSTEQALTESFHETDKQLRVFLDKKWKNFREQQSGTTAVMCIVERSPKMRIVCANVGDSRAIIIKNNGKAVPLSEDHSADLESERKRILAANGFVSSTVDGKCHRVLGSLAVARALGDFDFKMPKVATWGSDAKPITEDLVIATPEIMTHEYNPGEDMALLIACDGIWNTFGNRRAAQFVSKKLKKLDELLVTGTELTKCNIVAKALVEKSIERGSKDNCSVTLVRLTPPALKSNFCTIS